MKIKAALIATTTGLLLAGTTFALDHSKMHQLMMKQGGPKDDTRTELMMPEPMKTMHKTIMRSHLDAIGEIVEALAADNLDKAADISKNSLGWSEPEKGELYGVRRNGRKQGRGEKILRAGQGDAFECGRTVPCGKSWRQK